MARAQQVPAMSNPGVIVLNQNTKREQGKKAPLGNIAASNKCMCTCSPATRGAASARPFSGCFAESIALARLPGRRRCAHGAEANAQEDAQKNAGGKLSEANLFVDTTAAR